MRNRFISLTVACMMILATPFGASASSLDEWNEVSPSSVVLPDPDMIGGYKIELRSVTATNSKADKNTSEFTKSIFPDGTHKIGYSGTFTYSITAESTTPNYRVGIYWVIPDNGLLYPEYTTPCYGAESNVYETLSPNLFDKNAEYVGCIENLSTGKISGKLSVFALYVPS